MLLNPWRFKNTVDGLSTRCMCLVSGISGIKTSSASVWVHQSAWPGELDSWTARAARYVAIRAKIRNAMKPDSIDSGSSHRGRTMNRLIARPVMPIATATANTAAKAK